MWAGVYRLLGRDWCAVMWAGVSRLLDSDWYTMMWAGMSRQAVWWAGVLRNFFCLL
jgi:hypothetical protein